MSVEVTRGSLVECTHKAHIAVVNSKGNLICYHNNPHKIIYARSSIKPIQAIQCLKSKAYEKFNISEKELSLICSSHNSKDYHIECTKSILKKSNVGFEKLKCGVDVDSSINNTCSGKHSGMLASIKSLNEDLESYLDINHNLQQRILDDIANICDYDREKIIVGKDGCGAPVHALPIERLAYGFSKIADSEKLGKEYKYYVDKITSSMMKYPEMVGGENTFCTDLMKVCGDRIFGKFGSQGVYLLGDKKNKLGVCVKIEDGSKMALDCVVMEVLKQLNLITKDELESLSSYHTPKQINSRNEIIGEMKSVFKLNKL